MQYYAGIDISLEQSSVCVVDAPGKIVKEAKVASDRCVLATFCPVHNRASIQARAAVNWRTSRPSINKSQGTCSNVHQHSVDARYRA
jgi:hypothetical protein